MSSGIAVIIPVFNHAAYLEETLLSVTSQTLAPDRIIALDDGSTDQSPAILENWKARGIEVHHQANQGAAATLNKLVAMAAETCPWIAILNSDDLFEPDRLALCLQRANDSGAQVVTTELTIVDEANATLDETAARSRWFRSRLLVKDVFQPGIPGWLGFCNYAVSTSNIFAAAEYVKRHPFSEALPLFHDYLFLIQAALTGAISHLEAPALRYRTHASNAISVDPQRLHTEGIRLLTELDSWLSGKLTDPSLRLRYLSFLDNLPANFSSLRCDFHQCARLLPEGASAPEWSRQRHAVVDALTSASPSLTAAMAAMVEKHPLLQENRVRRLMLRSRWLALGNLLGWKSPRISEQIPPREASRQLQHALRTSKWVRAGAKIGSKRCRKLLEILESAPAEISPAKRA